jgi:hypothetical protein
MFKTTQIADAFAKAEAKKLEKEEARLKFNALFHTKDGKGTSAFLDPEKLYQFLVIMEGDCNDDVKKCIGCPNNERVGCLQTCVDRIFKKNKVTVDPVGDAKFKLFKELVGNTEFKHYIEEWESKRQAHSYKSKNRYQNVIRR